jgi:transcriptional repressor NrdR
VHTAFTKRPIRAEEIEQLIDAVEAEIFRNGELEVSSRQIGEILMEKLRQSDPLAYIRFASVYREFADLDVMRGEINKLAELENRTRELENQHSQNGTTPSAIAVPDKLSP